MAGKVIRVNLTKLADKTGYSISHLSLVFRLQTRPSIDCLRLIADALGTTMDALHAAIKKKRIGVWKNH